MKQTLKVVGLTTMILGSALLAGCARNCIQMAYGSSDTSKNVKTSNGVFQVMQPGSALASGNLLRGKVVVQNESDKQQSGKYKFQWYNDNGMNAGESTPWQPFVLSPNSSQVVSDTAPSPSATRYNVLVCQ